ncbi:hypothetical protein EUTSA_v10006210mg [Eutrema salsugineum]|uniref:Uncharacterized protein n=1 Tax=Eutrema salsugineum TaxID=72664 RepID=V4ND05_EUTSA|nr:uncharacterized protein LOC18020310 [Eutrema salsugineum]ESQ43886.1 hypothetical protein EUTSA_v10006210mg [Eutrema salsugineum]
MSNRSGRSWYRLSSIVRPTPHSSRDPSPPRDVIQPPQSPTAPPSHPPPPQPLSTPLRPPPIEVHEAKPSPVTSSRSIKHEPHKPRNEHEITHRKNISTLSEETNLVHEPNKEGQQQSDDVIMGTQRLITISGENKGAVMEIIRSPSPRKTRGIGKGRRLQSSSEDDEGEESKSKTHSNNGGNLLMDGFVNSNVQVVNGSVVYNSAETHYDPGVHLSLYRKPNSGNGFSIKDHGNGYNSSTN